MKLFCDYHPTRAAHWNCGQCGAHLCPECVSKRDGGGFGPNKTLHFCPKCNLPCEWVGITNLIEPFWKRMPRIFAYPFSPAPLILIGIMAFASLILQEAPGIMVALIRLVIGLLVLKYAFESLKATARGNLKPPKINSQIIFEDFSLLFKQGGIFLIIGAVGVYVGMNYGFLLAAGFFLVSLFFVPSMIILLVTNNRLFHALNPIVFVGLVFKIGWPYLLMYFFLALIFFAPYYLAPYIFEFFPQKLHFMLDEFARSFYMIVSYHLMGYVILQYHDKIGYEVSFEDFSDPSTQHQVSDSEADPDAPVFSVINPLIQEGKLDEAISQIQSMTKEQGIKGVNLSERYYNLLKIRKRTTELLGHGTHHLKLLVRKNTKSKALKVYVECMRLNPEFLPSAEVLFKLGGWLNESGKAKEALGIYNRLIKSYPQNPIVPKTYFRVAQIFHDRLLNVEKAKKMLGALKAKYPDHDIIPQVTNYLANI
jgi:tetratricopeptide (TPR) repeat protein